MLDLWTQASLVDPGKYEMRVGPGPVLDRAQGRVQAPFYVSGACLGILG